MALDYRIPLGAVGARFDLPHQIRARHLDEDAARLAQRGMALTQQGQMLDNAMRLRRLAEMGAPAPASLEQQIAEYERRRNFVASLLKGVTDEASWQRARGEIVKILPDADAKLPRQFDQSFIEQSLAEVGQRPAWVPESRTRKTTTVGGRVVDTDTGEVIYEAPAEAKGVEFTKPAEEVLIDGRRAFAMQGSDGRWYVDGQPVAASRVKPAPPREPGVEGRDPYYSRDFGEYKEWVDAYNRQQEGQFEIDPETGAPKLGPDLKPVQKPYQPPMTFDQWRIRFKKRDAAGKPVTTVGAIGGAQKFVTHAELVALAKRRGTSTAEELQRARQAGYVVR